MNLISMECPKCRSVLEIDSNLDEARCNYCGAKFRIHDEFESNTERIIKKMERQIDKNRKYYSSDEYKKRLEIQHDNDIKNLKSYGIFLIILILLMTFLPVILKLG